MPPATLNLAPPLHIYRIAYYTNKVALPNIYNWFQSFPGLVFRMQIHIIFIYKKLFLIETESKTFV